MEKYNFSPEITEYESPHRVPASYEAQRYTIEGLEKGLKHIAKNLKIFEEAIENELKSRMKFEIMIDELKRQETDGKPQDQLKDEPQEVVWKLGEAEEL